MGAAAWYYYLSLLIVGMGVEFGYYYLQLHKAHPDSGTRTDMLSCYANWDGRWYQRIASDGYTYSQDHMSSVVFFPLYPKIASVLIRVFGLRSEVALLIVSHTALIGAFYLFLRYLRIRRGNASDDDVSNSLLAFAFFPMTFFMRMTYTESLCVLLLIASLYAMATRKPLIFTAVLITLAILTRSVGAALVPVFVWHIWKCSRNKRDFLGKCAIYVPICFASLAFYMWYLDAAFGNMMAFSDAQIHWKLREDVVTLGDRLWCLLKLEPILDNFNPERSTWWAGDPRFGHIDWLNIRLVNLFWFFVTVTILLIGWRRRILLPNELILSAFLLLIPIMTIGVTQGMTSMGRYVTIIFPVYIVLGRWLSGCSPRAMSMYTSVSILFMFIYSSLFAAWHWYY